MKRKNDTIILGAGITGLSAGMISGFKIYEASDFAGGICSSYYVRPGGKKRLYSQPADQEAYRFDIGGGHWIFGNDPAAIHLIHTLCPTKTYRRISGVYFTKNKKYVPYPIQNNLYHLDTAITQNALTEIATAPRRVPVTMKDWLLQNFGQTLTDLFFGPFHELYTAGLWTRIAPQDAYKSPVAMPLVIKGALERTPPVGYNVKFVYPEKGLGELTKRMASFCNIDFHKRAVRIDPDKKVVFFDDASEVQYTQLLSTIPLNRMMEMTNLDMNIEADPSTSVLVLNIGGLKGPKVPDDHWLYIPDSKTGFHRIGFYSNVDVSFLPFSSRETKNRVSIYVEQAFRDNEKPSGEQIERICKNTIEELQELGFVSTVEVADPTWIDVAYTWSWPNSNWRQQALKTLAERSIHQIGRYARWNFQGIVDSVKEGLTAGSAFKF